MRHNPALLFGVMAGMLGPQYFKMRPSKENCVQCNKQIPPGKAGRKCETCRKEDKAK